MQIKMTATNPAEIEMTLTATMTLGDWMKLRDAMEDHYPGWALKDAIRDAVNQAQKSFIATETGD